MKLIDQIKYFSSHTSGVESQVFTFLHKNFSQLQGLKLQYVAEKIGCTAPYISYILKKYELGTYRSLKFLSNASTGQQENYSHTTSLDNIIESLTQTHNLLRTWELKSLSKALIKSKHKETAVFATGITLQLMKMWIIKLERLGIFIEIFDYEKFNNSIASYKNYIFVSITGSNVNLQRYLNTINSFKYEEVKSFYLLTLESEFNLSFGKYTPKVLLGVNVNNSSLSRKDFPTTSEQVLLFMLHTIFKQIYYEK